MQKFIRDNPEIKPGVYTVCQCGRCSELFYPRYEHICETFNSFPSTDAPIEKPKDRVLSRDAVIHTMEHYFVDGKISFKNFYQIMMDIPTYATTKKKKGDN